MNDQIFPPDSEYMVRQYRPSYFRFPVEFYRAKDRADILNAPWLPPMKHDGFDRFKVWNDDEGEICISAHYVNGEHWIAAFAVPVTSKWMNNWRYGGPKSGVET